ncbi:hypothetical protein [Arthrobacter sp. L77]|uniref:hypothetical protein n=1 Tax=Arthrobacter sp. L77 TaxID=1496689 RepID=UPI0005B7B7A3|nr:hypothetical protein [Arthrobacter sp. L77]
MTATLDPLPRTLLSAPRPVRWHRPLLGFAALMLVFSVFALVVRFIDPVEVTGLNQWDKPLKFSLSMAIYAVTWSWLIGQLERFRRVARVAGTVIVVTLIAEMVVLIGAAALGTTSHFNVSTPAHAAAWGVMGAAISVLWIATLVAALLLFFNHLGDSARAVAIRSGAALSLVGLGLGYLMTGPTSAQLADPQGIVGAHTVGLADGGPGLPILGWSTSGGDLRIPHFVGMHALQAIPLALIAMELLSRRVLVLRDVTVRTGLVWVAAASYAGFMALVTWQALRGESIVSPGVETLTASIALMIAALLAGVAVVVVGRARIVAQVRR